MVADRIPVRDLLLVVAVIAIAPVTVAGSVPLPPATYYGQVLVDGEPAPDGIAVVATLDGQVRGSINTGANGTFGGSGAFDEKLTVPGSNDVEGEPVTFEVGGRVADSTVAWSSGDHRRVTLSVDALLAGDANADGEVDIYDATLVGRAWHCTRAMPCYDPRADLDADGEVDIFDAVLVGRNWGRTIR